MNSKEQPHDLEVEKAVLGCVMLDNRLGSAVCGSVATDCFYDARNQAIFEAIKRLTAELEPVDAVTVHGRLSSAAKNTKGMPMYLSSLTDSVSTVALIENHIEALNGYAKKRRLIVELSLLAELGYSDIDTADFLATSRKTVTDITDTASANTVSSANDLSKTVYDEVLSTDEPPGLVRTWIKPIDSEYGGLWPGVVTMLAARPSMGKSALALSIIANAALSGKKVLFFSLEDTKEMVMKRMYARFADIDLTNIVRRTLNLDEVKRLEMARDVIGSMPINIDDTSGYTPQAIRGKIQQHVDRDGVDLVVLDHLLKVRGEGNGRYEKITDAIEQITRIVKDTGIANLILHQLNRQNVMRENKIPTLSDLRGSGDIEQEIRVAWFLHRDYYYDPEQSDKNEALLLVAKNSHGPTGSIGLRCDLSRMYFGYDESR
jgi:replicative DNA helicase